MLGYIVKRFYLYAINKHKHKIMNAIIKNQSTLFADKTIQVKPGSYVAKNSSWISCEEGKYARYKSVYMHVDNGTIEVLIAAQIFELKTGRDGHVEVCVLENHAGEIVGFFV
jgi:hypothetical protein